MGNESENKAVENDSVVKPAKTVKPIKRKKVIKKPVVAESIAEQHSESTDSANTEVFANKQIKPSPNKPNAGAKPIVQGNTRRKPVISFDAFNESVIEDSTIQKLNEQDKIKEKKEQNKAKTKARIVTVFVVFVGIIIALVLLLKTVGGDGGLRLEQIDPSQYKSTKQRPASVTSIVGAEEPIEVSESIETSENTEQTETEAPVETAEPVE